MGLGQVGLQRDRPAVRGDRVLVPPLGSQGDTEVAVNRGRVRLQRNGPVAGGDRLVEPALVLQDDTQVDVGVSQFRLQFNGAVETGNRLFPSPRLPVGLTQVAVIFRNGGVDSDRPADQINGPLDLACLVAQHT